MQHKVDEKGIIYIEEPKVPTSSIVISLFSLILISLGALSILVLQKPLQEVQNIAPKATVQNGPVTISTAQSPSQFTVHQLNTVDLLVNTGGVQTQGVTAVFNVITNTTDSINVETLASANLKASSQEVQKTSDGFLVRVVAEPTTSQPFSTTSPTRFLRITFNPYAAGQFQLAFDQDYSHVYLANSHDEELSTIGTANFPVVTDIGNQCNQSCENNGDCASNLRCYNKQCRLATNVTSTTCSSANLGAQRTCNQGCADTTECATGFVCFYNRCRAPEVPDSTTCGVVTQNIYTGIAKSCNVACSSNKECAVNLRCFDGACRLATNPGSLSCTPATYPTVSNLYTNDPLAGKKGDQIPAPSPTPTSPNSTTSGTVKPSASPFVWPSPSPVTNVISTPKPVTETPVASEAPNALSALTNHFTNLLTDQNLSFPLLAVAAGIVLLLIAILLLISQRRTRPMSTPTVARKNVPPTEQEKSLQQKIADLQKDQVAHPGPRPPVNQPHPPAPKVTPPPPTLASSSSPTSSTMYQRLQDKHVMDQVKK